MNQTKLNKDRIRKIFPELQINTIKFNDEGLTNDVVIVNDELVFRFPKSEYAADCLKNEIFVLKFLKDHISLDIPIALYESDDAMCYPLLAGETLRRNILLKLDADAQQFIADQLATFHKELHGVPVAEYPQFETSVAVLFREDWIEAYRRIKEKVFPLLQRHTCEWAKEHFESFLADKSNFEYQPKLIHADLMPYHVLFDSRKKRIGGIIDFGCAGLGDPAIDFGRGYQSIRRIVFRKILQTLSRNQKISETRPILCRSNRDALDFDGNRKRRQFVVRRPRRHSQRLQIRMKIHPKLSANPNSYQAIIGFGGETLILNGKFYDFISG